MENNLFKYATKELSQDAFLCYLFSFGKDKTTLPYPIVQNILKYLNVQGEIKSIKRQENKIDVLVLTDKCALIIEDKINTGEHDRQIETYRSKIHQKYENLEVIVAYVKTGFLSEQEQRYLQRYKQLYKDKFFILKGQDLLYYIGSPDKYNDLIIKQWTQWQQLGQNEIQQAKKKIEERWKELEFSALPSILEKNIYLDTITQYIREYTQFTDSSWWMASGRTPHIELQTHCIQDFERQLQYSTSAYMTFAKKEFSLIIKQHIFPFVGDRIKIKDYDPAMRARLAAQCEQMYCENKQHNWGWHETPGKTGEKLTVLEKKFSMAQQIDKCVVSETKAISSLLGSVK